MRGLLMLPPVVIVLRLISLAIGLLQLFFAGVPLGVEVWIGLAIAAGPLVTIGVLALVRLLQERRSAKPLLIVYFSCDLILNLLVAAGNQGVTGENPFVGMGIYRDAVVDILIIGYVLFSKRVRLTLTGSARNAPPAIDVF